jgi:hypothetical protein
MRTNSAHYLLLFVLLASGASAQEGRVVHLGQPVIACERKTDLRDFPAALPKTISLAEMPLPYREGRCIRLAAGPVRIARVQGTYACLRHRLHSCLWVRSEDAGAPMVGDFPDEPHGASKLRRSVPDESPVFSPDSGLRP